MADPKDIICTDFQKAFDKISFKETKHSWDNRGIFLMDQWVIKEGQSKMTYLYNGEMEKCQVSKNLQNLLKISTRTYVSSAQSGSENEDECVVSHC